MHLNIKLIEECSINYMKYTTKIFVNGSWIGCTADPLEIINIMKLHRRNKMIDIYTSITFNIKRNEIKFIGSTVLGDEIIGFTKIQKITNSMVFLICHLECKGKIIANASGLSLIHI